MREYTLSENSKESSSPLIDAIDAALHLTRKLGGFEYSDPLIQPLSRLERLVVQHIRRYPGSSPSEISRELALKGSNASAAINGLVKKKHLRREPDPNDGRGTRLFLTDSGQDSVRRVHREWETVLEDVQVSDEQLKQAAVTFELLFEAMNPMHQKEDH